MYQALDIVGGAYQDSTRSFDSQDCVNYLPESAQSPGARARGILRGLPGLTLFATAPDPEDNTSPAMRGVRNVEGRLFVVMGQYLYEVSTAGVFTSRGTIPGTGRVSMSHQQITNGYEVIIVNGSQGYVYNTVTTTLVTITDSSFPGSFVVDFIDQYFAQVEPGRGYWFHSDLASATSYLSTDRYEAEASPDKIVTLIVDHREVWVLGERTIEIYSNTGGTQPFARQDGTVIEQGCGGRYTVVQLDNSIFWLGNDGIFYRANGYTPVRISTHAVEQEISDKVWSSCYAFTWSDRGHKVIYWTFPDGLTWGYDAATGLWHRRESYQRSNWRVADMVYWNNQWISGDSYNGKLYIVDWDNYTEDDDPLVASRTIQFLHANQNEVFQNYLELVMAVGLGNTDSVDRQVSLRFSDDGGFNWSAWNSISIGQVGGYTERVRFWRLGRFTCRTFQIQVSSPVKRDLITAAIEMREGMS